MSAYHLAWREVVRFLRQPSRIAGALGTPLVLWALFGTGFAASFRGGDYRAFFVPGVLVLVALFTAVFSAISVIEDRAAGFLQGVLAAPVPRAAIPAGRAGGAAVVAAIECGVFLALVRASFGAPGLSRAACALFALALVAAAATALGVALAWRFRSTQGFHAVMNLVLLPLWVISGSVFPLSGLPGALRRAAWANPFAHAVALVREALSLPGAADAGAPPAAVAAFVVAAFLLVAIAVAARVVAGGE